MRFRGGTRPVHPGLYSDLDHVFVPARGGYEVRVADTKELIDTVQVDGRPVPVSDHVGYVTELEITPAADDDRPRKVPTTAPEDSRR